MSKTWFHNNGTVEAIGMDTIEVEMVMKDISKNITLKNVLHVPKMKKNLFFISKLQTYRYKVKFYINGWF